MTKIYSLNSDVKFPDMEHYDMGKASDMALYLAHCDFYPFRSVIENNKIALDAIDERYRNLAEEAMGYDKRDFTFLSGGFVDSIFIAFNNGIIIRRSSKYSLPFISQHQSFGQGSKRY